MEQAVYVLRGHRAKMCTETKLMILILSGFAKSLIYLEGICVYNGEMLVLS